MTPAFEAAVKALKRLPGLGHRSAERLALHLFVEQPESLADLLKLLGDSAKQIKICQYTGNVCEGESCSIYADHDRDKHVVCIVERVPDLVAMERAGVFRIRAPGAAARIARLRHRQGKPGGSGGVGCGKPGGRDRHSRPPAPRLQARAPHLHARRASTAPPLDLTI